MTTWDDLRSILQETAGILSTEEQAADTLDDRTRQLARQLSMPDVDQNAIRVLTFTLGTERYGWTVSHVRAITLVGRITPVPSAPDYYRGVISLRGQVLSVMDLGTYLNLPPIDQPCELMIVIDGAGLEIGVLASTVFDVISIPTNTLSSPSSAGLEADLITGITADGLIVLDAEALLRREKYRAESAAE